MQTNQNSNWYKLWILYVRILNREIVRSATIINKFLSIVENGFRSPNFTTRAEAFICWKVLIEILAKNNELVAPKRLKLVCIPLKSSQSKTIDIAVNKFKVWWYLICKMTTNLTNHCDTVLAPFLVFCFGPLGDQPILSWHTSPSSGPGKV